MSSSWRMSSGCFPIKHVEQQPQLSIRALVFFPRSTTLIVPASLGWTDATILHCGLKIGFFPKVPAQVTKAHSLCKQCLHDLHFLKKGSYSTNLYNLARADISRHFMKTRSLCRTVYLINGFQVSFLNIPKSKSEFQNYEN